MSHFRSHFRECITGYRRGINATLAVTSKVYEPHSLAEVSTFGFRGEGMTLRWHAKAPI